MTADHPTTPDDESEEETSGALWWEAAARTFRPYAGWLFIGFGGLLILLGYLGVSRESLVAKQLPYLISGGVGGIMLAIVGAYFLGTEQLRKDSGRLDRIESQVDQLHRLLLQHPDAPPIDGADGGASDTAASAVNGRVVRVAAGGSFHRPDCTLVLGKDIVAELDVAGAVADGLRPCPVCDPQHT